MCWSEAASYGMAGLGAGATVWTAAKGHRWPIPLTLGYFTVIEALQAAGYQVVDRCGDPANRAITLLSYLHIAFQPPVINAFAMELIPAGSARWKSARSPKPDRADSQPSMWSTCRCPATASAGLP